MESITKVYIKSEKDDSSITFFCNYPFHVNQDDLFTCSGFFDYENLGELDKDTYDIIDDCADIDFIDHGIEDNVFTRTIWMKCRYIFPFYDTFIKDGKVTRKTKDEYQNG